MRRLGSWEAERAMIKFRDGVGRVGMTPVTLVGSRGM